MNVPSVPVFPPTTELSERPVCPRIPSSPYSPSPDSRPSRIPSKSLYSGFLALVIALLVFATAAVFLFAELAFGRRLRVVYAMLHRFCCAKKGEDRLEVVIG